MTRRRRIRALKAAAIGRYSEGYVAGTNLRNANAGKDMGARIPRAPTIGAYLECPARDAGFQAGMHGERIDATTLPLDVWVQVLALHEWRHSR